MATTTIALTQEAYERLKKQKLPGESFSDVVLREIPVVCETAGELVEYAKSHPGLQANEERRAIMLAGRGRRSRPKLPRQRP
jgi:predicted CopG family antitoxin